MREENYIETFDDESDFVEFLKSHGMVAKLYYEKPKTGCSIPVIDFDKPKEQPEEEKRGYYYVVEKEDKKWRMSSCENAGIVYCSRFSKRSLGMTRREAENNLYDAISAMMEMALNRDKINTFWDSGKIEAMYEDKINDGRSWYDNPKWLEENGND